MSPRPADPRAAIEAEALRLGFDVVGFTHAHLAPEVRARLFDFIAQGRHGSMGWMAERAEQRAHPQALWPEAVSVVVLGLCTRPDSFVPFVALSKEVRIVTSAFFKRQEYEAALDALDAGDAEPRLLVTDTVALDQVPAAFEALKTRTHQCKVLIAP